MRHEMIKVEIEEILKGPALEGVMVRTLNLIIIENHKKREVVIPLCTYMIYIIYMYIHSTKNVVGWGKTGKRKVKKIIAMIFDNENEKKKMMQIPETSRIEFMKHTC